MKAHIKKVALLTALFGERDDLVEQPIIPGVDLICFSDQNQSTECYEVKLVPDLFQDAVLTSRIFKMMPHLFLPEYDVVIWHDANIRIKEPSYIGELVKIVQKDKLAIPRHYCRNCIYDEAEWVKKAGKDTLELVMSTTNFLLSEGYPAQNGLVNAGLIARLNRDKEVETFNALWWKTYSELSKRDQLSFNYVAWKLGFDFHSLDWNIYDNPFVEVLPHKS